MIVDEVDVLNWYGQPPDREEINNVVQAARDSGQKVADKDFEATRTVEGEQHFVLILYLSKKRENF